MKANSVTSGHLSYIQVGVILAIITALEVAYPYLTEDIKALAPLYKPVLGLMSLAKFLLVVGFFMHLKFDHPLLKQIFAFSLLVTTVFFTALLFLFDTV